MTTTDLAPRIEALGPAERLIHTLLSHADHLVHNRSGVVVADPSSPTGVRWSAATWKAQGDPAVRVVFRLGRQGRKTVEERLGVLGEGWRVLDDRRVVVAQYRQPGLFPEVAAWTWRQIAAVWQLDNEFAARWASHAFTEDHRDLKVALAAFLLVQSRRGDPVRDQGQVVFFDEDYRDVGEAMCLIRRPDGKDLSPKLLLRIHDLLSHPEVATINRELGFGISARNPALGRWPKVVERWLRHREHNPRMLDGLVRAGFRTTVIALAQRIGYKPDSDAFFRTLRWKQKQAADGRRSVAIGVDVAPAESWADLDEAAICERITASRPDWKRLTGLLPGNIGVTRAIAVAAVEAGSLSDTDLIVLTPTLEDLGLLGIEPVKSRWEAATTKVRDQRAANIAARVRHQGTAERLQQAAETAVREAVHEAVKGLVIYFFVDISGSMSQAIEAAKTYTAKLLGGFPLDKVHVAVFNTSGREVVIRHASQAGVEAAFRGISAGGGTDYGSGVLALAHLRPGPDEEALFLFVGDEQAPEFSSAVQRSGLAPPAFGLLKVSGSENDRCVRQTASILGIPCFPIDPGIFADPYAIPRTLRNLIAATPVTSTAAWGVRPPRVSLVETILKTDLLQKPEWAGG